MDLPASLVYPNLGEPNLQLSGNRMQSPERTFVVRMDIPNLIGSRIILEKTYTISYKIQNSHIQKN